MNSYLELTIMGILLTNLLLLTGSRFANSIRAAAIQGILLALYALFAQSEALTIRIIIIAVVSLAIKGIVFPKLLQKAMKESGIRREQSPFIGYTLSAGIGALLLFTSLWLGGKISLSAVPLHPYSVPASFMTLFTGLLLIIARRSALMQCVGYVVCENGVYMFGMAAVGEIPALVELGMLFDAFAAVFVMGIAIFHIRREFDHVDTDSLSSLKG